MLEARDPAAIPPVPNPIAAMATGAAKTAAVPPKMAAGTIYLALLAALLSSELFELALSLGGSSGTLASFFPPSALASSAESDENTFVQLMLNKYPHYPRCLEKKTDHLLPFLQAGLAGCPLFV